LFSEFDERLEDIAPSWPSYNMDTQQYLAIGKPGNPYSRERLSTVNLLLKIGCFVKRNNVVSV